MDIERQHHIRPMEEEKVSIENLQVTVDRLQELVCHLLIKNEKIRTASMEAKAGDHFDESLRTTGSLPSGTLRTSPTPTDEN